MKQLLSVLAFHCLTTMLARQTNPMHVKMFTTQTLIMKHRFAWNLRTWVAFIFLCYWCFQEFFANENSALWSPMKPIECCPLALQVILYVYIIWLLCKITTNTRTLCSRFHLILFMFRKKYYEIITKKTITENRGSLFVPILIMLLHLTIATTMFVSIMLARNRQCSRACWLANACNYRFALIG